MDSARQQQMRRLAPEECDSFSRADCHTHHRCRGTVDPARQIDRKNQRTVAVDGLDHIVRLAGYRAIETRAEQRIDDQSGLADRLRIEGQHRVFPTFGSGRRVALQALAVAKQDDRNFAATRRQFRRGHKSIAAVISGSRNDQDWALRHQFHGNRRHCLSCAQHQREPRPTGCDREPIGSLHFSWCENFHAKYLV